MGRSSGLPSLRSSKSKLRRTRETLAGDCARQRVDRSKGRMKAWRGRMRAIGGLSDGWDGGREFRREETARRRGERECESDGGIMELRRLRWARRADCEDGEGGEMGRVSRWPIV